ncbi:S1 RNA-binding domain-containing protein [Aerococcus tenax]|uniref:CvfB family protein n=1 Tax=Aerococcus tenax TaxID=3078812 RepID=UPI0018A785C5|nr:S1-like domain-containing RNA-binding protein [Aerococcus tenax]
MKELASVVSARVSDYNAKNYYVQFEGKTFELNPSDKIKSLNIGQEIPVFIYTNQKNQAKATLDFPKSRQNTYGWAEVTQVRHDLGVFLDIGLPDKDMVLSMDELPSETGLWPKKGDKLYVKLSVDRKDRQWANLADSVVVQSLTSKVKGNEKRWINQVKKARVYQCKLNGSHLITEDYYLAFIHPSEWEVEPRLGEEVEARVIGIGQNGNLNLSLKPRAFEVINDDAEMIYQVLKRTPEGFLPYNDKSDPNAIRSAFNISKAQFKRALGHLMKTQRIEQNEDGITLKDK